MVWCGFGSCRKITEDASPVKEFMIAAPCPDGEPEGPAKKINKLAPVTSPGKTWEGTIGGICGGLAMSTLFLAPTPLQLPLSPGQAVLLGALTSILGQVGDLFESLFKRNLGVKDSGKLMPGHGGVLDRIDSLIFAGIVVYYYAVWVT